ncbi:hypothetical protein CHUAL_011082 [Chamberlinius hualienensis]
MAASQAKICKLTINLSKKLIFRKYNQCNIFPSFFLVPQKGTSTDISNCLCGKRCNSYIACINQLVPISFHGATLQTRKFSTTNEKLRKGEYRGSEPDSEDKPKNIGLMDFPEIKWPGFFKSLKNIILTKLIVRPYFDQEFSIDEFNVGARKAFLVVSRLLRDGKFEELAGLLVPEAIEEIKNNFKLLTPAQMQWFAVQEEDIYLSFPYQLGIMLEDIDGVQQRHVEITFCCHCLLGLKNVKDDIQGPSDLMRYKDRIFVGNCRFIKEFTKGVKSDWTMNVFNVFKPSSN